MAKRKVKSPWPHTVDVRDFPAPPGFPDTVKINGQTYRVLYRNTLHVRGVRLHGMVTSHDRTILLDINDPVNILRETLLHEMAHVYFEMAGLRGDGPELEKLCDIFASSVVDLTENNQWPDTP